MFVFFVSPVAFSPQRERHTGRFAICIASPGGGRCPAGAVGVLYLYTQRHLHLYMHLPLCLCLYLYLACIASC